MRADAFTLAAYWALRSQNRRRAGEHAVCDGDLANVFGGEWGLAPDERGRLLRLLLAAEAKRLA